MVDPHHTLLEAIDPLYWEGAELVGRLVRVRVRAGVRVRVRARVKVEW